MLPPVLPAEAALPQHLQLGLLPASLRPHQLQQRPLLLLLPAALLSCRLPLLQRLQQAQLQLQASLRRRPHPRHLLLSCVPLPSLPPRQLWMLLRLRQRRPRPPPLPSRPPRPREGHVEGLLLQAPPRLRCHL